MPDNVIEVEPEEVGFTHSVPESFVRSKPITILLAVPRSIYVAHPERLLLVAFKLLPVKIPATT